MIGKRIHKILFTKKWNGYKEESEEALSPSPPYPLNISF